MKIRNSRSGCKEKGIGGKGGGKKRTGAEERVRGKSEDVG